MRPVLSKEDYFRRWQSQEFGNKLRSWARYEDIVNYAGLVTMRHVEPSSTLTQYLVPVAEIPGRFEDSPAHYRFNESAPDSKLTMQGELTYGHSGWQLLYSLEKLPMRQALRSSGKSAVGLTARSIMKHFLCPSSLSDMEALVELYPDHVVEFSCYSSPLGNVANRNTIVWEVRKY